MLWQPHVWVSPALWWTRCSSATTSPHSPNHLSSHRLSNLCSSPHRMPYLGPTPGPRRWRQGPFFPFPHSRSPDLLLHRSDPFLSDPSIQGLPGLVSSYFPVAGTLALTLVGLSCTVTSSPHVSLPDLISATCLPVWSPRPLKALTSDKNRSGPRHPAVTQDSGTLFEPLLHSLVGSDSTHFGVINTDLCFSRRHAGGRGTPRDQSTREGARG